jgi:hypothetical protein
MYNLVTEVDEQFQPIPFEAHLSSRTKSIFMKLQPLIIVIMMLGCNSDKDVFPTDTWSQDCKQLSADADGYQLLGLCCANLRISKLKLHRNQTFSAQGILSTFTGAGFHPTSVAVSGHLSMASDTLYLNYKLDESYSQSFVFTHGPAKEICTCLCY